MEKIVVENMFAHNVKMSQYRKMGADCARVYREWCMDSGLPIKAAKSAWFYLCMKLNGGKYIEGIKADLSPEQIALLCDDWKFNSVKTIAAACRNGFTVEIASLAPSERFDNPFNHPLV